MAKKSNVDVGKGFKRIYFAVSAIWMLGWIGLFIDDASSPFDSTTGVILAMIWVLLPIPVYYVLLWFIQGFKK